MHTVGSSKSGTCNRTKSIGQDHVKISKTGLNYLRTGSSYLLAPISSHDLNHSMIGQVWNQLVLNSDPRCIGILKQAFVNILNVWKTRKVIPSNRKGRSG